MSGDCLEVVVRADVRMRPALALVHRSRRGRPMHSSKEAYASGVLPPGSDEATVPSGTTLRTSRQVPLEASAGQHIHHCREHGPLIQWNGPPSWGRKLNDGSKGLTSSHRPSETNRCDRSAPTRRHRAAAHTITT